MMIANVAKGWPDIHNRGIQQNIVRAKAKIVIFGALETILNSVINNQLHEELERKELARVISLAEFRRQQEQKVKPKSRRTYYVVGAKIYCKKPSGEFVKVRASSRTEVRVILAGEEQRAA